ncbi:MAG: DUF3187 family protein [Planctomycetota bacterium]
MQDRAAIQRALGLRRGAVCWLLRSAALAGAVVGAAGCAHLRRSDVEPRHVVRGPLPTRVMLPQALVFPEPRPRSVQSQAPGTLGGGAVLSYASIYEFARVPPDVVELDAEVLHLGLFARYGLTADTDIELELPVSFASSGFLDAFVDEFHALFGFPDGDRGARARDEYALTLAYDGEVVWERREDTLELMDIPVRITHVLQRPDAGALGVAVRAGVELPTGDVDRGTGSDGVDYDLGVLLERSRDRWTWTGGIDYVQIDAPEAYRAARALPEDIWLGTIGLEYRWDDASSLLAGLRYRSPFTDTFRIKEVDRPILDLSFGFARDVGRGRWFAAFHEDVLADSGPDVGISLGVMFAH